MKVTRKNGRWMVCAETEPGVQIQSVQQLKPGTFVNPRIEVQRYWNAIRAMITYQRQRKMT